MFTSKKLVSLFFIITLTYSIKIKSETGQPPVAYFNQNPYLAYMKLKTGKAFTFTIQECAVCAPNYASKIHSFSKGLKIYNIAPFITNDAFRKNFVGGNHYKNWLFASENPGTYYIKVFRNGSIIIHWIILIK